MRILKFLAVIGVCILLICTPCKAEITPQLLTEWGRQPSNVKLDLYYQRTNIQVVDKLPWESPNLYATYAYTKMKTIPNTQYVYGIDMYIKTGEESSLTHEVGHCISNYQGIPYYWCNTPTFDAIWQAERANNIMMYQGRDNKIEYFACAYDMYIRFNHVLRQSNPMTYEYIKNVLKYI